jgi:hypothetical protein
MIAVTGGMRCCSDRCITRFIHLPRDLLAVSAGRMGGRAVITSVFWLPNE